MGAYAVTEAGAGSDVKSLRTTAKLDGDEWVLNGTKVFISNGGIADVTVVVATVDPELGHRGQASFVVPKGTPGLSQGKKEDKIGIRASQAAYEWTLEYLEDHVIESQPALEVQHVQQVMADVATEIEASRLLVWRAAWMGRNGIPMTGGQGSMSKLKAGDVTMWATTTLMDLVGPYAQTTDCPLEKWFRDAKIYQIFEGTAQVQRLVVSRMQRQAYIDKMKEAAEVLEQAPGAATGNAIGDAAKAVATA